MKFWTIAVDLLVPCPPRPQLFRFYFLSKKVVLPVLFVFFAGGVDGAKAHCHCIAFPWLSVGQSSAAEPKPEAPINTAQEQTEGGPGFGAVVSRQEAIKPAARPDISPMVLLRDFCYVAQPAIRVVGDPIGESGAICFGI